MTPISFEVLVLLVVLALAFDFMNGFHDAANSIATIVSTRVLRPQFAVAWAAFFNFIAFLFFGLAVANTIGRGVIDAWVVDQYVLFGALVGSGFLKITLAIVASPALGFALGMLLMTTVAWVFQKHAPYRIDRWFRRLQLVSASLYSLGHRGNDAQKTMGVIALTLFLATGLGIPVSTTHTITGSIVGVGATSKLSAVRWGVAGRIVWAWVLTIPCSALIAATDWWVARLAA
jgi:PiT family inorganic phosphate transporter